MLLKFLCYALSAHLSPSGRAAGSEAAPGGSELAGHGLGPEGLLLGLRRDLAVGGEWRRGGGAATGEDRYNVQ